MKSLALKLLSVVLLSSILFSCSKEDDGIFFNENSELTTSEVSYSEIENKILTLVNEHRKTLGLTSLSTLNIISSVADSHTDYMIETGKISHDNFNQRAEILMNNTDAKSVGENVAYGYNSAEGVLKGWLNSDSHRKVIESANYTHFGISTESNSDGRNYFTQIFIKK
ncbi:MAG: CAP domain-containing protein [Lutibacter sp.]|nr:CAP domain-containing protein [Lutibacter sp.]